MATGGTGRPVGMARVRRLRGQPGARTTRSAASGSSGGMSVGAEGEGIVAVDGVASIDRRGPPTRGGASLSTETDRERLGGGSTGCAEEFLGRRQARVGSGFGPCGGVGARIRAPREEGGEARGGYRASEAAWERRRCYWRRPSGRGRAGGRREEGRVQRHRVGVCRRPAYLLCPRGAGES